jgi:hypothetical protein
MQLFSFFYQHRSTKSIAREVQRRTQTRRRREKRQQQLKQTAALVQGLSVTDTDDGKRYVKKRATPYRPFRVVFVFCCACQGLSVTDTDDGKMYVVQL